MDFVSLLDPDLITKYLSATLAADLTHQIFLFSLAAWIHSGRVKKEIRAQFSTLTNAIHGVENKLGPAIQHLDFRITVLETRNKGEK